MVKVQGYIDIIGRGLSANSIRFWLPKFTPGGRDRPAGQLLCGTGRRESASELQAHHHRGAGHRIRKSATLLGMDRPGRARGDRLPEPGHPPDRQPDSPPGLDFAQVCADNASSPARRRTMPCAAWRWTSWPGCHGPADASPPSFRITAAGPWGLETWRRPSARRP